MKLTNRNIEQPVKDNPADYPGYPLYPAHEDIYNQYKKEGDIDPEDISKRKQPVSNDLGEGGERTDEDIAGDDGLFDDDETAGDDEILDDNEIAGDDMDGGDNFDSHRSGNELDVPGSELDDPREDVGSEDEENNYYSLADETAEDRDSVNED